MKKILPSIVVIAILSVTVWSFFRKPSVTKETFNKSQLSVLEIDGVKYETTGTIPSTDENGNLAMEEGIKLLYSGPLETDSFSLKMPGDGSITVELYPPHEANKEYFLGWLKENGYSHLDPFQFNYINAGK